jgi:hypothetical protein
VGVTSIHYISFLPFIVTRLNACDVLSGAAVTRGRVRLARKNTGGRRKMGVMVLLKFLHN